MEYKNVETFIEYLKNHISDGNYKSRKDDVMHYYEKVMREQAVKVEKFSQSYVPTDYQLDLPIYYIMQIELFLGGFVEYDRPFVNRILPKIEALGSRIEGLQRVENIDFKINELLKKNNKSFENYIFELLVASLYLKNGYSDIEIIKETSEKTPDLRVGDRFVECKRKIKECDYSVKERQYWYEQFQPVSDYLFTLNRSLVFNCNFKNELSTYYSGYLLNIIKRMISRDLDIYENNEIKVELYDVNYEGYNNLISNEIVRVDQPLFFKKLFGYDDNVNCGITQLMKLRYKDGYYKISPEIEYANAGIWHSLSENAEDKKMISIKNNIVKAIRQIPKSEISSIHLCYESYNGKNVENGIKGKAQEFVKNMDADGRFITNLYLHILRPISNDEYPGEFEEDCIEFHIDGYENHIEPYLLNYT